MKKRLHKKSAFKKYLGIIFLPLVLVVGGVLIEIAAAAGILTFLSINANQSTRTSAEALHVARAGIADALMQIINNKNYASSCYRVYLDYQTAYVVVTRDVPAAGQTSIYSKATVVNRTRTLSSLVSIDATSGKLDLLSVQESTSTISCP